LVVVKESVRFWPEEQELLVNYSGGDPAAAAWVALPIPATNLIITKTSLAVFQAGFTLDGTGRGGTRIKLGNYYVGGLLLPAGNTGAHKYYGICYLPAGNYAVVYEGYESVTEVSAAWLKLGVTNFSDLTGDEVTRLLNQTIAAGGQFNVVDQNITGTLRECCIGTIRKHIIRVQVVVICHDVQKGDFVDSGLGGAANTFGISIYKDTTDQQTWTSAHDDASVTCAGAAYGELAFEQDIATQVNIKVTVKNGDGNPHDYDTYWSIAACPWLMCEDYARPVLVNVPQASNINVLTENLDDDDTVTKYVGLGTQKALGYNKVYSETSGTKTQTHSDALTELPTHGLELFHKGFRNCVTLIAADRRG